MPRTLFAAGRIPARNATRTPETPAMSQMPPECTICRDADATDAFGWCDACAALYDQPEDEAPASLPALQASFTNDVIREILSAQILTLRHFPH